jgi:hypothetical protein
MRVSVTLGRVVCGGVLSLLLACEEQKPAGTSAVPSAAPTPAPVAKKAGERPTKIETEVTADRRAAVEAKYPAAKGFIAASELQTKLKADKTLKDKKAALTAFDKQAKGKWLLFTGPLVNLKDDAFDMAFEYTPQLPNDPMGMSRQFFEVSMSKVEGYDKELFKGGNLGVVLVKYTGAAQASPGYELVALGAWP